MKKNARIYVAGHRGLVGSAIIRNLHSKGYKNIIIRTHSELDLKRQLDVENFLNSENPEYIFLAAAKVGGILANSTYKAEYIYDNIMIATNVIQSAFKFGVQKLLNLGSSCIYPKFAMQPMKEEYLLTGYLEATNEPYAIAKISAIKLCRYYNEQYGTNFISAMPTNLYGPNDSFNLKTAHVLPALIRKFHLAKLLKNKDHEGANNDLSKYPVGFELDKEEISDEQSIEQFLDKIGINKDYVVLWGSGEPYREFLYIDDFANACMFLMENCEYNNTGEFINVGTGKDIQIKDLAVVIKDIVGFDGEIKHDPSKPDGTPKKLLDISRMQSLGWESITGLMVGIRKTYDWYLAN